MKNKILIITVVLVILAIGIGAGFYFSKISQPPDGDNLLSDGVVSGDGPEKLRSMLIKDDFSIMIPNGWKEAPAPTGVSAMVVNISEKITDQAAQKINFQSYYSVNYDILGDRTGEEYVEYVKESLKQFLPEIIFVNEYAQTINGKDIFFIESEATQRGADFTILMAITKGNNDDIWTISFNAAKSNFVEYKNLFNEVAGSFEVK